MVKIGITPPWGLWEETPARQRELLNRAADGGIDHLFVADHVSFKGGNGSDGIVHLAALSGIEPRLDLHLGIFLLALRHPVVAARQIMTLTEAAPGRVMIGVGVGGEDRDEFIACGVDPTTRGRRTDAAMAIVRRLLDGEKVTWQDEFFDLTDVRVRGAQGQVPMMVGGRSDRALERAGELGDGWLASWCSPKRMKAGIELVENHAETVGRQAPADGWVHGTQFWVGVGKDQAEGRANVSEAMESFYKIPFESFERYTPCGTATDIADYVSGYIEAGSAALNLTAVGPDRETEIDTMAEVKALLTSRFG